MKFKLSILTTFILSVCFIACKSNKPQANTTQNKLNKIETVSVLNKLQQIPLPENLEKEFAWEFDSVLSDDFNYTQTPTNNKTTFKNGKWTNFFNNDWDGPGTTYWKYNKVSVNGSDLVIKTSRWNKKKESNPISRHPNKMKMPNDGISTGCVTSTKKVLYPVFIETKISVTDLALASDVWLLSRDSTQEIDIIECYGGKEPKNNYFAQFIHLSHHSFIRKPFTDYQPTDLASWYKRDSVKSWGDFSKDHGKGRNYVNVGVFWKSPVHFEYYIDGELVRVLHDKSVATKTNGNWVYGYPTMTNGKLDVEKGRHKITEFKTESTYSLSTLMEANKISTVSIIDPYAHQGGKGIHKKLDIIINVEAQSWHALAGRTPSDEQLNDPTQNNNLLVDWIRVFKPKN